MWRNNKCCHKPIVKPTCPYGQRPYCAKDAKSYVIYGMFFLPSASCPNLRRSRTTIADLIFALLQTTRTTTATTTATTSPSAALPPRSRRLAARSGTRRSLAENRPLVHGSRCSSALRACHPTAEAPGSGQAVEKDRKGKKGLGKHGFTAREGTRAFIFSSHHSLHLT